MKPAGPAAVSDAAARALRWSQAAAEAIGVAGSFAPVADEFVSAEQIQLRAIQAGDSQAFAALLREHQQAIYGYFRARVVQPHDADDLAQEVFVRCYLGREKFERCTGIRWWLLGIAHNVLLEHVRGKRRRKEVAWTTLCLELDDCSKHPAVAENAAIRHLPTCMESLGKSAREALDMHYHSKLKLTEIGARLKRSEGAVKLLMYRARQALKNCLEGKIQSGES